MNAALRRLHPALIMVAVCVSLLALVAAAAGAGYAAATIGTAQLKNKAVTAPKIKNKAVTTKKIKDNAVTTQKVKDNAVTTEKVKDGSLSAADMVAEEKQIPATLSNGGEGDCVWSIGSVGVFGVGLPTFRKDRFGRVHMTGYAVRSDAPGGDGACDGVGAGQVNDAIAFTLPAGYIPAKTTFAGLGTVILLLVGAQGITAPGVTIPPGSVIVLSGEEVVFESVSYDPVGSSVAIPKMTASGRITKQFVESLGLS